MNEFALVRTLVNPLQNPAFSAATTKDCQDSSHSLTWDLDITTCGIFVYRAPIVRDRAHPRKCLTFTVAYTGTQCTGNFLFLSLLSLIDTKLGSLLLGLNDKPFLTSLTPTGEEACLWEEPRPHLRLQRVLFLSLFVKPCWLDRVPNK